MTCFTLVSKKTCEKEIEALLYQHPKHTILLDHFMVEYNNMYSRKLSPQLYGYPKLIKLLESFSNTVVIKGTGPSRPISLEPIRVFACEIAELVSSHSGPMPISKIVPVFKEKFGRELLVNNYGYPKLIKALESIPDVVNVSVGFLPSC